MMAILICNSLATNHAMRESYKETAMLRHWMGSLTSTNEQRYLPAKKKLMYYQVSVHIIIIITIEYISICY